MLRVTKAGDTKNDFYAWLGILGPPTIWITNFQCIYSGVLSACANKSVIALLIACVICLALIGGCGFLAMRELGVADANKTRRFMAHLGLMSTVLFVLVTIAQTIALFIVDPCVT